MSGAADRLDELTRRKTHQIIATLEEGSL